VRDKQLDMTVFNRSNDLIYGCCGANAVHFPIVQEYIAGKLGIPMGMYWQISTNLHLYNEHIDMLNKRSGKGLINLHIALRDGAIYEKTQPLMTYPEQFDEDIAETVHYIDLIQRGEEEIYKGNIANSFLRETVIPMALAHALYKKKNYNEALDIVLAVKADDWCTAGTEWIERHIQ